MIPRLIGIPKDDELKPWELPSGKLSFETRLRREVDEPPTYYPMPTSGRRAHSDIVRGLVHNDIVAANDETRLRGEYTPRAGGGVAVAMAGNADGAVAPPLPNPKRRNEMWLVGNNKDLKHVYKPHLDGHTQYGLEGHGYGEGLTSLTGIPVEEKSPRLRGMAADRRVQAFEHRHNDTDVTNPWGKKEWEFCEPRGAGAGVLETGNAGMWGCGGSDLRADYFEKDFRREAAASEARLRAEQGQFLGHPNPNALRSSNIQHPVYRRKGTLRSGVSPMGFGV